MEGPEIIWEIRKIFNIIEKELLSKISKDVKMGIILRICFLLENILGGVETRRFEGLHKFKDKYSHEMGIVRKAFASIINYYKINIGDDEIAYRTKLFLANRITVE